MAKNEIAESSELLNKRQAAEFCKVSEATIQRWMEANKVTYIKIGARVLFRKDKLIDDLKKFEVPVQN
ncbi:MAG: helix-turn-helix domain-containing protein [Saprospiraceae bacterium]